MIIQNRGMEVLETGLSVLFHCDWFFVACKYMDDSQIFFLFQQICEHTLTDGYGF
jgi:hypothetical protein